MQTQLIRNKSQKNVNISIKLKHLPISSGGGGDMIGGGINKPVLAVHASNVSIYVIERYKLNKMKYNTIFQYSTPLYMVKILVFESKYRMEVTLTNSYFKGLHVLITHSWALHRNSILSPFISAM